MPELPEVETMRRGLAAVAGARIVAVEFPRSHVRPLSIRPGPAVLARRLEGRTIADVLRRGKRVVLELTGAAGRDEPHWLAIEPRMTGLMLVADPPSPEHVRLVLRLAPASRRGPRVVRFWDRRGLGTIRLHDRAAFEAACGPARLGPDGLAVGGDDLASRLSASRRAVKVALLDQRVVAGIGNIYAAEILFRVGIDPRTPCRRLPLGAWARLAAAMRHVLAEAVRLEGSSIDDETYRTADNRLGRFQHEHRVYGRADEPCTACGTPIVRLVQAQRATFFCPSCQARGGSARTNSRGRLGRERSLRVR
ncbi:MAG: bifunctional DNA-formamidopyrimidine glycosylase/DNA-(apurinic or apyrimidinic site) lyase [Planctomycetia bacterium]|nr:bifunctional DNA-formamidopyrimidine glycosylase/DNA-(apurinic or apyrimidinic site) lyase [Planctomycetia bacterium]